MDYLFNFILFLLAVCVTGVFLLLCFVVYYIYKQVKEDSSKSVKGVCIWKGDEDTYKTNCHNTFYDASESGNPVTDWLTYCPYCGDKIKE